MKINAGFFVGSKNQVSSQVLDGVIEVSEVASVVDSLKFSVQNLLHNYSLNKDCGIDIDFKKWLELLQKRQNVLIYFKAIKMLKSFAGCDFTIDSQYGVDAAFDKKETKEAHVKYAESLVDVFFHDDALKVMKECLEKTSSTSWFFNPNSNAISYVNDDIVITLSTKVTKEIFKLISEHVNKNLDNALTETEEVLEGIQGLDVLCQSPEQTRAFLMKITDILFDIKEGDEAEYYDNHAIADILKNELKFKSATVF